MQMEKHCLWKLEGKYSWHSDFLKTYSYSYFGIIKILKQEAGKCTLKARLKRPFNNERVFPFKLNPKNIITNQRYETFSCLSIHERASAAQRNKQFLLRRSRERSVNSIFVIIGTKKS